MQVVIDCREHKIIQQLNATAAFEYDVKQLDIGDIHICDPETNNPLCVIERKTISDLESSIVDGRYKEQKARMVGSGFPILYIIEYTDVTRRSFGAIINTQVRDRIPMMYSSGVTETIKIINHLMTKEVAFFINNNEHVYEGYSAVHIKKSKNITVSDIYVSQLAIIPGISRNIGNAIKQEYPSMSSLICAFNASNTPATMLTSIKKVGTLLSKRIFENLCASA